MDRFDKFTDRARTVLTLAQDEAHARVVGEQRRDAAERIEASLRGVG